jgi:hypothetical protein
MKVPLSIERLLKRMISRTTPLFWLIIISSAAILFFILGMVSGSFHAGASVMAIILLLVTIAFAFLFNEITSRWMNEERLLLWMLQSVIIIAFITALFFM